MLLFWCRNLVAPLRCKQAIKRGILSHSMNTHTEREREVIKTIKSELVQFFNEYPTTQHERHLNK